jgi:hypothetical protein
MRTKTTEDIEKAASSRSINKTISEFNALIRNRRIHTDSVLRQRQHAVLYRLLRERTRWWYLRGFERGHEMARRESKSVPQQLKRAMRMRGVFLPKAGERIVLRSNLKR